MNRLIITPDGNTEDLAFVGLCGTAVEPDPMTGSMLLRNPRVWSTLPTNLFLCPYFASISSAGEFRFGSLTIWTREGWYTRADGGRYLISFMRSDHGAKRGGKMTTIATGIMVKSDTVRDPEFTRDELLDMILGSVWSFSKELPEHGNEIFSSIFDKFKRETA